MPLSRPPAGNWGDCSDTGELRRDELSHSRQEKNAILSVPALLPGRIAKLRSLAPMPETPAAEFVAVTKDYPLGWFGKSKRRAVRDVTLTIPSGQVFGLLGPNRAGKTTLVKTLLSLAHATTGTIRRLGEPVAQRRTLARVGYVHENHAFPCYLTPAALMDYYGRMSLVPYEVVKKRAPLLLERVGLADRADDPIRTFSKGMIQRLGVAQALINDPDLLVLDEPNEGLDLTGRQLVADVIQRQRQKGERCCSFRMCCQKSSNCAIVSV